MFNKGGRLRDTAIYALVFVSEGMAGWGSWCGEGEGGSMCALGEDEEKKRQV